MYQNTLLSTIQQMNFLKQKKDSELHLDYERLELLSSERNVLKENLESIRSASDDDNASKTMISTGTSFLVLNGEEASFLLNRKLQKVEDELRDVCKDIQERLEEKEERKE